MAVSADALNDALPQTQCTRCGYPDCRSYAVAIAEGSAEINRCPPGGAEGIARLAALSGRPLLPLDPACGREGPRHLAVIDEAACIGCTRCLPACPVDCIVGGPKSMHTVIARLCTGCELCVPACPVDCIALVPVSGGATGWQAWSPDQAAQARSRHDEHRVRLERNQREQRDRLAAARPATAATLASAERSADAMLPDTPPPASTPEAQTSSVPQAAVIESALRRARDARGLKR